MEHTTCMLFPKSDAEAPETILTYLNSQQTNPPQKSSHKSLFMLRFQLYFLWIIVASQSEAMVRFL